MGKARMLAEPLRGLPYQEALSWTSWARLRPGLLFNHSVVSDSLWPWGLQPARLPCLSLSPRVCSNAHPLSWWCHPIISSSVASFSCLQFFPASGSFPMSQLFPSGGQNIGASASVFPMKSQGWFPLGLTSLTSLLSKSLLQHHSSKASILWCSASFLVQLSHSYMTTEKILALTIWTFVRKEMSLLFNTLSRFVTAFLLRSKHLLI